MLTLTPAFNTLCYSSYVIRGSFNSSAGGRQAFLLRKLLSKNRENKQQQRSVVFARFHAGKRIQLERWGYTKNFPTTGHTNLLSSTRLFSNRLRRTSEKWSKFWFVPSLQWLIPSVVIIKSCFYEQINVKLIAQSYLPPNNNELIIYYSARCQAEAQEICKAFHLAHSPRLGDELHSEDLFM